MSTIYAIQCGPNRYLSRGGRRCFSIPQMWLFNSKDDAEKVRTNPAQHCYVPPSNNNLLNEWPKEDWKVVTLTIVIGE